MIRISISRAAYAAIAATAPAASESSRCERPTAIIGFGSSRRL
jgi:hypothetical protein